MARARIGKSATVFDNISKKRQCDNFDSSPFDFPNAETLESLADVYFRYCHNQPYCYFEEHSFRAQLRDGSLPQYLLLAFAATAARFSDNPSCTDHQPGAMRRYAKTAWQQIITQSLDEDHSVNIHTVQAANMLGVLDYLCMSPAHPCLMITTDRPQPATVRPPGLR